MSRFAVLIPYFNPANYRSHIHKLARCLGALHRAGLAADVFLTGGGQRPPCGANIIFWEDECSFMWHKERLVNLAVRRLPGHYTHVVWVDSDLIVGTDWALTVAAAFRESQVVQCFRTAHCRTIDNRYVRSRVNAFGAGHDGAIGLAWGSCRSLFTQGPGLFELGLVGGGDAVFGLGVLYRTVTPSVPWLRYCPLEPGRSRRHRAGGPGLLLRPPGGRPRDRGTGRLSDRVASAVTPVVSRRPHGSRDRAWP